MRVVDRKTFLALPEGTIYAKGKEWFFGGLSVKYDTTDYGDWWSLDPCWIDSKTGDLGEVVDLLEAMLKDGKSEPMETAISRDGLFQEGALFLVFERGDLMKLREFLDKAVALCN
jgi:hypothetical protein